MSLLSRTQPKLPDCACQERASTGSLSLRVEPQTVDIRDKKVHNEVLQLQESERLQDLFLPGMDQIAVHQHTNGFHAHPEQPGKVAHLSQLHDMMDKHGLVARLQITPSAEHTAVSVALAREHVADMFKNGFADVKVPLHDSTFRLHSTREGRLTGVEYI